MLYSLLGPLEVSDGDRPVRLGSGRQRSVLILLLLRRNEVVSSDRLVDTLWGEAPPPTAAKVLQNYVGQLRRALGDRDGRRLQTRGHGYALRVEDGECDVQRFERLVARYGGTRALDRPAEASAGLGEALAMWRGPPLADVAYEGFAQQEIARLEELRGEALERRIDADLTLGRHPDLVAELESLVNRYPLREHLRAQRMLALYRCGRQSEALEAFRDARTFLVDEIGVEPGPELQRLHEAVLRHDTSLELPAGDLPGELEAAAATAIVGRGRELAWLRERWERACVGAGGLVVVAGEHGIGKTRLVAELAGEVHRAGCSVLYAAAGAAGTDALVAAMSRARDAAGPSLVVVDGCDAHELELTELPDLGRELSSRPVLATVTVAGSDSDVCAGCSLVLDPLDLDAVRGIALLYAPDAGADDVPADELLEASDGVPRRVHTVANAWARRAAARRAVASAPRAAAGRLELRAAQAEVAGDVAELQAVYERADLYAERATPVVCPFKGLACFEVADAKYFFGREQLVAELVARAVGAPLLGVVGPSGSGKSSVVRAGLLPALADGVLPGSEEWPQLVVRPGEHPMRELHRARFSPDAYLGAVLVVDQFEEVFSTCRDEGERAAFIEALVRAAEGHHRGGVVIVALRADYYGRCAAYPALAQLLGANHVLVGPMQPDELGRAIELPARRVGLQVERDLVEALVSDVKDEPGALPLLSTALLELWQYRDGRRLRCASYERTGGVRGAVARLAEDAYGRLDADQQVIARRLFLRLAGEDQDGAVVRRQVALTELAGQGGPELTRVLAALADRRLLTMSATTVEVAHEALLREWPRLRGWLDEDAQGRRVQRHLIDNARDWAERGRDAGDLYRGARLAVALEWRAGHEQELSPTEGDFLDASRVAGNRAQRRLRTVLAGVAALLAVAVAGGLVALHQHSRARSEARAAAAQRIGVPGLTGNDLARTLLLARQGVALDDSPATRGNLLTALLRSPAAIDVVRGEGPPLNAVDISSDGRTLVVGDSDGALVFLDALTRRPIGQPYQAGGHISGVRFSADDTRVAVVGYAPSPESGFIKLVDARTHRGVRTLLTVFNPTTSTFVSDVGTPVFSPDSRTLVADFAASGLPAGDRRYAMRWDARSGRPLGTPKAITSALTSSPALVGFIARGTRLVTSSAADNQTVIRDATTLLPVRRLRGGGAAASVTADGHVAALGGPQGSVRLLDLRSGAMRVLGGRQTGPVAAMQFTPDSRTLLTAGQDARFTVWDVEHASAVRTFAGAPGSVSQLAIAPDGRTAYSAGVDGSLIGFDLTRARWLGRPFRVGPAHPTGVLALTAKGSGFAVPKDDRSVDLLDTRSLTRARRISFGRAPSGARQPLLVAAAPDGRTLAAGTPAGQVGFADPGTGQLLGAPQEAHVGPVSALAFSHDGRWLVTAGEDRALYVWDARRRKIASHFVDLTLPATSLSVNPSDTELAATVVRDNGSGELDILAIPRLALLAQVSEPRGVQTRFSSNGRLLFYADDTGRVWTLDTRDWEPLGQPLVGQAKPGPFALSPDERILATTSANGTTQLWDTASRLPIGSPLPGVARDPVSAAFVDGGTHLVTLQSNGNGFVWDVQPQSWARRACAVAGRELTRKEWQDALPGRDYAPACVRR